MRRAGSFAPFGGACLNAAGGGIAAGRFARGHRSRCAAQLAPRLAIFHPDLGTTIDIWI